MGQWGEIKHSYIEKKNDEKLRPISTCTRDRETEEKKYEKERAVQSLENLIFSCSDFLSVEKIAQTKSFNVEIQVQKF